MKYNSSQKTNVSMKFDPRVTCMGKFMFVYITLPSNVTFHQYPHATTNKSVNCNQTCNYLCAVFPEAIPAIITEKARGLHVITDFRPPKKNMRMRTGHPQTFLHSIFSCHLARNPCSLGTVLYDNLDLLPK